MRVDYVTEFSDTMKLFFAYIIGSIKIYKQFEFFVLIKFQIMPLSW